MAGRQLLAALSLFLCVQSGAQEPSATELVSSQPVWSQLNAQQRTALAPLAKNWNKLPDERKRKWMGISRRYAKMTPIEQARMQDRMREWITLSPAQREIARNQYRKLRTAPQDQKAELGKKWQEYAALPSDEKQKLQSAPIARVTTPTRRASQPNLPYTVKTAPRIITLAPPNSPRRPLFSDGQASGETLQ